MDLQGDPNLYFLLLWSVYGRSRFSGEKEERQVQSGAKLVILNRHEMEVGVFPQKHAKSCQHRSVSLILP